MRRAAVYVIDYETNIEYLEANKSESIEINVNSTVYNNRIMSCYS